MALPWLLRPLFLFNYVTGVNVRIAPALIVVWTQSPENGILNPKSRIPRQFYQNHINFYSGDGIFSIFKLNNTSSVKILKLFVLDDIGNGDGVFNPIVFF